MSTPTTLRGVSYNLPEVGDVSWGDSLSAFLGAIPRAARLLLTFGNHIGDGGTAQTYYLAPVFSELAMTGAELSIAVPVRGVLRNLYVKENTPHVGSTITYAVRVNGVDTYIQATSATAVGTASNSTNSHAVLAGDLVSIRAYVANSSVDPADVYAFLTLTAE